MIEVRVQPRAKRNAVVVEGVLKVKVYVTAPAEGGRANASALALLADALGVAKSNVSIMRGNKARDKVVHVEGLDADAALRRLRPRQRSSATDERSR